MEDDVYRSPIMTDTHESITETHQAAREMTEQRAAATAAPAKSPASDSGPATCPFDPAAHPGTRRPSEQFMRRLLFIRDTGPRRGEGDAERLFTASILISATRCLLSYVIFPIFAPAIDAATGAGPAIGLPIGVLALVFDVLAIRRFWAADHRWRWQMPAIYVVVIAFVSVLLVSDFIHLIG